MPNQTTLLEGNLRNSDILTREILTVGKSSARPLRGNSGGVTQTVCIYSGSKLRVLQGGKHATDVPELLGTTDNELGIRKWLEDQGHTLVTTHDKEGENSQFWSNWLTRRLSSRHRTTLNCIPESVRRQRTC